MSEKKTRSLVRRAQAYLRNQGKEPEPELRKKKVAYGQGNYQVAMQKRREDRQSRPGVNIDGVDLTLEGLAAMEKRLLKERGYGPDFNEVWAAMSDQQRQWHHNKSEAARKRKPVATKLTPKEQFYRTAKLKGDQKAKFNKIASEVELDLGRPHRYQVGNRILQIWKMLHDDKKLFDQFLKVWKFPGSTAYLYMHDAERLETFSERVANLISDAGMTTSKYAKALEKHKQEWTKVTPASKQFKASLPSEESIMRDLRAIKKRVNAKVTADREARTANPWKKEDVEEAYRKLSNLFTTLYSGHAEAAVEAAEKILQFATDMVNGAKVEATKEDETKATPKQKPMSKAAKAKVNKAVEANKLRETAARLSTAARNGTLPAKLEPDEPDDEAVA